jgi:hypothetical protein
VCNKKKKGAMSPFLTEIAIVAMHEYEHTLAKIVRISLKAFKPN